LHRPRLIAAEHPIRIRSAECFPSRARLPRLSPHNTSGLRWLQHHHHHHKRQLPTRFPWKRIPPDWIRAPTPPTVCTTPRRSIYTSPPGACTFLPSLPHSSKRKARISTDIDPLTADLSAQSRPTGLNSTTALHTSSISTTRSVWLHFPPCPAVRAGGGE
jgi:hypothetical protein